MTGMITAAFEKRAEAIAASEQLRACDLEASEAQIANVVSKLPLDAVFKYRETAKLRADIADRSRRRS